MGTDVGDVVLDSCLGCLQQLHCDTNAFQLTVAQGFSFKQCLPHLKSLVARVNNSEQGPGLMCDIAALPSLQCGEFTITVDNDLWEEQGTIDGKTNLIFSIWDGEGDTSAVLKAFARAGIKYTHTGSYDAH